MDQVIIPSIALEIWPEHNISFSIRCSGSTETTKGVKLDFSLIHAITTAHPLAIMLQQQWSRTP
jgi:hypothetical protein